MPADRSRLLNPADPKPSRSGTRRLVLLFLGVLICATPILMQLPPPKNWSEWPAAIRNTNVGHTMGEVMHTIRDDVDVAAGWFGRHAAPQILAYSGLVVCFAVFMLLRR